MDTLKKLGALLLVIFFPIGLAYCFFHSLGKDLRTFIGTLVAIGIGFVIAFFVFEPTQSQNILQEILNFLKNL